MDKRDIAASLGVAFGAGMESYNRARMVSGDLEPGTDTKMVIAHCTMRARTVLNEEWDKWLVQGLDRTLLATCGDVQEQLTAAVEYAITHDPTPPEWSVVHVEETMPDHGNARADVVYELPTGEKVVRDYKFALSVPSKYVDERLNDYAVHPQSYHYPWMHGASMFIPTLVIASPRPSLKELHVQRTQTDIAQWLTSQAAKWTQMEAMETGLLPVWKSDIHKSQYGKCPLYDFCMVYEGDENRLPGIGFVKVERRK